MGGHLTVSSKEHCGSTFTFVLPYKIPSRREHSDDTDEESSISDSEVMTDTGTDEINGSFIFKLHSLGTLYSSGGSTNETTKMSCNNTVEPLSSLDSLLEESDSFSSSGCIPRETAPVNGFSSVSHSTNSYCDLQKPRQNLDHDTCITEAMNRREECLDFNSCNMGSKTQRIQCSDYCAMRRSGGTNVSASTIHRHEKGPNFRSTPNGSAEQKSSLNRITGEKSTSNGITGEKSTSNGITEEKKMKSVPKILLVEDNKINVMVAQSMMKQLGHNVDIANNGLEAIRAVQRSQYDLVLMVRYHNRIRFLLV